MRIWIITVGEPLPIDEGQERLLRSGILVEMLRERGHEIVWWTSTFDHVRKQHRFDRDTACTLDNGASMRLLHGCGYRTNISWRRILDHAGVARRFTSSAAAEPRPDVILCSFPTLELSVAATRYGRERGIPVVLDIRDLWPDILLELAPQWLRPIANLALWPMWRQAREACRGATAICASSPRFVKWGLSHAGRDASVFDRDFPFGYLAKPPATDRVARAYEFWRAHGVSANDGSFVACFFGTMGDQFDLETVIDAAGILERRGVPVKFVLCGAGPREPMLKQRARGLRNVMFPGWVGAAEIWTLMRLSSVGLAPYLDNAGFSGNYPNKTIEYLSAALPVVSSLRGYFRALLEECACGVTYPSNSSVALADAISAIRAAPDLRAALSVRAEAVYNERFEGRRVYEAMIDHLSDIADAGRAELRPPA